MGEYETKRSFSIDIQDYQHTDSADAYVYQYRLALKETEDGKLVGYHDFLTSEIEDIQGDKLISNCSKLIKEYFSGDGPFSLSKLKSPLLKDHGDQFLKFFGVSEAIKKAKAELSEEKDYYEEYEQLCIEWEELFDLPLEKGMTVKEYVEYIDNIPEEVLYDWGKRMIKNNYDCSINSEYSDLGTKDLEFQKTWVRDLIDDIPFSNEGWSNGFFEADIFDDYDPDNTMCDAVGQYIEIKSVDRIDCIIKDHIEEIVDYIFN